MTGPYLEIDCPHCQQIFSQNAKEITVRGSRTCPFCHEKIEFSGAFLFRILRKMERFPRFDSRCREENSRI